MFESFSVMVSFAAVSTFPAVSLTAFQVSEAFCLIAVSFPPVATSIALKAPVTTPFSAFNGAIAREESALKAPEKIFFSPSSAFCQSPVKIPVKNCIIP